MFPVVVVVVSSFFPELRESNSSDEVNQVTASPDTQSVGSLEKVLNRLVVFKSNPCR